MTPAARGWWRRLRLALLATGALCVITLGVLAGLTQLAMPWLAGHPEKVEAWLAAKLGREVRLAGLDGHWVGGGPVLQLQDVRIAALGASPGLRIPRAALAIDLFGPFRRNGAFSEFRLDGLELALVREAAGWRLHGLDIEGGDTPMESISLGGLGAVGITDLTLAIIDAERGLDLRLEVPVLRIVERAPRLRMLGRVRPAGYAGAAVELVAELDPAARKGRAWIGARKLDLARLPGLPPVAGLHAAGGRGAIDLWLQLADGAVGDVRLRIGLDELRIGAAAATPGEPEVLPPELAFERFALTARWQGKADSWQLDVADVVMGSAGQGGRARLEIERTPGADGPRWRVGVRGLPLAPIAQLASLAAPVPAGLRGWLQRARPEGRLESANLDWQGAGQHVVAAKLRGLRLREAGAVPGLGDLDLDLTGDAAALLVEVPDQALAVDYPHVFREPLRFAHLGGDVVAWRDADGWWLATDRLRFEGEGYGGELRGGMGLYPDRRPVLDLYAAVTHGEVPAAKLFWPINVMPAPAVAWLDRGLAAGRVAGGRAAFRGDLADWPFRNRAGRMIARAEVAEARLEYDPHWPAAEAITAVATFIDDGMRVEATAGGSLALQASHASAVIENLAEPVLQLEVRGRGSGTSLIDFLRATPVGAHYREELRDVGLRGRGNVSFALRLPIEQVEAATLDGQVELADADLRHGAWNLDFTQVRGEVHFSRTGVLAESLEGMFRGEAARLSIAIGSATSDPANGFEAALAGRYPASVVFADVPALLPVLARVTGTTEWRGSVQVANGGRVRLLLDSALQGMAIDFPPPLGKPADGERAFHLELPMPLAGALFDLSLGSELHMRGRLPSDGEAFAARMRFGGAVPQAPLPLSGIAVEGRLARVPLAQWLAALAGGEGSGVLAGLDLEVADLVLAERHFRDQRLEFEETPTGWRLGLDGPMLAGEVAFPSRTGATVDAHFRRLSWPDAPQGASAGSAGPFEGILPASLPPLAVAVDDFRLGEARLGPTTLVSHPQGDSMRIASFTTRAPEFHIDAEGTWSAGAGGGQSRFRIALSSKDLGGMLAALGFGGVIAGGVARIDIGGSWNGPPSAFSLAGLTGELRMEVGEGRILEVEPGAGRLLGLLSIAEIPRRLTLDFSDLFRSGFSFNSISGSFRLAEGNAWTEDLQIKGPAADVAISGRTGLRARDYDQRMDVTPHAGSALPVVGAITGGPVGAAAGVLAQGILSKPLARAVERRYRVTGSWDKPEIVQEREESSAPRERRQPPRAQRKPARQEPRRPGAARSGRRKGPRSAIMGAMQGPARRQRWCACRPRCCPLPLSARLP